MRQSNKVSKKLKLSKGKINYRKHERTQINQRVRRVGKVELRKELHERRDQKANG